jgi:hypothetical protein
LDGLRVVIYNALVGNQIILCGDLHVAETLFRSLATILPESCITPLVYSDIYKDAWEATWLNLPPGVALPVYLTQDSYTMIEYQSCIGVKPKNMYDYTWQIQGIANQTTLGQAIEKVVGLGNERECILILVEEWLAKAKAYAKLRPIVELQKDKRLQEFAHAIDLNHKGDFYVLAFWTTGLRKSLQKSRN